MKMVMNENDETRINFNGMVKNCVKNKNLSLHKKAKNINAYQSEGEYQNSFDSVIAFSRRFTREDIQRINVIIYHENNDAYFSATIVKHAVEEVGGRIESILNIAPKKMMDLRPLQTKLAGKHVIIVDLNLEAPTLQELLRICASVIVIDDHMPKMEHPTFYSSEAQGLSAHPHSACACTWKFFYPDQPVPLLIMYVDSSDNKLHLAWTDFNNKVMEYLGFRYTKTRDAKVIAMRDSGELFDLLWAMVEQKNVNDMIMIGKYYTEVTESLKLQIAVNSFNSVWFQGYKVAVLNFRQPALTKKVGREMIDYWRAQGVRVDFSVLWCYEYSAKGYGITLIGDHRGKGILKELGDKLVKVSEHPRGGNGHANGHEYNLYWNRSRTQDIWDLFEKKLI